MSDKSLFPAAAKLVPECTDGSGSGDWYRATSFKMDVVPVSPRHAAEEDSQLSGKKRRRTGKSHKKNRRIHQVAMTAEADSSSDFSDVDTASMLAVVDGAVSVEGRAWRLDRRGDAELGHFGNVYRLDVPVYHTLDDGLEGRVSSDELARRTHAMPSGLVQPSVEKKMRREDLRKMDRRRRFFGSGAMADWRSLALPVCRRVRSDGRAAAAGPLPYFIAAPAASIDTSSGDIGPHPVSTDAEVEKNCIIASPNINYVLCFLFYGL